MRLHKIGYVTENAIIDANARQNAHIITQQRATWLSCAPWNWKLMAEWLPCQEHRTGPPDWRDHGRA